MSKPRIAVIGLGIMGRGIALNYLDKGYEVVVWNRSKEKTVELEQAGATVASSPAQATLEADFVFDVTATNESSVDVFMDSESGILSTATPDHILITCATLSYAQTMEHARICKERGLTFFDMPMTGSRKGAESGNLVLMVGGNRAKLEEIRSHLEPISSQQTYIGENGKGMAFKLILNAAQAIQIFGFGQAMRQAQAVGIDSQIMGSFLANIPGGLPTNAAWAAFQNFPDKPNFQVKWILKDLLYAKEMLDEAGYDEIDPALLNACIAVLQDALDRGYGDEDWTIANNLNNPDQKDHVPDLPR